MLKVGQPQTEINPPKAAPADSIWAIVGGRLIDGRGGMPVDNSVVVVHGTRIVAVGDRASVAIPEDAKLLDADGLSVLPGLIDSHFHSRNDLRTPVQYELDRGITSFRDPGHPFKYYEAVRGANVTLPRVFLCGGHLDAAPPVWPDQAEVIRDASHAIQTVNNHVDQGASAIKIYFRLPLDHIAAACEAARSRDVLVTAHLELVDADKAIAAGVRGIEHVTSFGTSLSTPKEADRFRSTISADSNARKQLRHRLWAMLDLDTSSRLEPVLETIVENEVFVSPTLAIFEQREGEKDASPIEVRGFDNMLRFVRLCHQAGANIVVGSHTAAPFAAKGFAYQRELELLVEAGLTPLEAIRAGTSVNARFFGIADRLGTIEPGKTADLLLVEGDPSADISRMKHVRHVMLNGIWTKPLPNQ